MLKNAMGLLWALYLVVGNAFAQTSGQLDPSFNNTLSNGHVRGIVPLSDGKILVAGEFTSITSSAKNRIVRLHENGTLDNTWNNSGANDAIQDMVEQPDGKILVVGNFTSVNGNTRKKLRGTTPTEH